MWEQDEECPLATTPGEMGGKGGVTDLEEAKSHDGGGECKRPQELSRIMVVRVTEFSSELQDGAPVMSGSRSGDNSGQNSQVSRSCMFTDKVR